MLVGSIEKTAWVGVKEAVGDSEAIELREDIIEFSNEADGSSEDR